jgi:hypothetical protein
MTVTVRLDYLYNMPELDRRTFEEMREYVEEAYRDSLRGKAFVPPLELKQATQVMDEIVQSAREHKHSSQEQYVGWAWTDRGLMWVKPGRSPFEMQRTTLHELAHLRVAKESHGSKWRRTFGVALALHMRTTGQDWAKISWEVSNIVTHYRKFRKYTPQGRVNNYQEYREKCYKESREILWAAKRVCGNAGIA